MTCKTHLACFGMMRAISPFLITVALLLQTIASAHAGVLAVHHELAVRLVPNQNRLMGTDTLTFSADSQALPAFYLNPKVSVAEVRVNDQPAEFVFHDGRLQVSGDGADRTADVRVTVFYAGVFDDPVPRMPVNSDNPGYGVTGTISEQGTFLLAGAGWYPKIADSRATFDLSVTAPEGVVAVTAGSPGRRETVGGSTVWTWSVTRPVDGLSLSAARYVVRQKTAGRVTAMTFMLPQTDSLAADYLDAVLRYIADYQALFGPYPFSKFAVVENFFPTGYGFASYTLLGSRVIRLPFIIRTSLGHEIAHCWWGNGVYVDYREGNWCEGLTTYVSDYRFKALSSPAEAREYRAQLLRNYATLVTPANDFPLSRFKSRYDPATKVIGYDKGAMVFHMIRTLVGGDAFWQALREVFRERLFETVSWGDLRRAFEARSQRPLDRFFDQWVDRAGAPRLGLQGVTATPQNGGWRVAGNIVQASPAYDLRLTLRLESDGSQTDSLLDVSTGGENFEILAPAAPRQLTLDPDFNVFRFLYPEEIPPAINSLKGSDSVLVVLSRHLPDEVQQAAGLLVRSLGLTDYKVVAEAQLGDAVLERSDLLLIGWPQLPAAAALPDSVRLGRDAFHLNGRVYDQPGDAFFGVFGHPLTSDRVMGVFLPLDGADPAVVARKITHYGKYSYLAFHRGENRDKGTWPTRASPLIHEFPTPGQ